MLSALLGASDGWGSAIALALTGSWAICAHDTLSSLSMAVLGVICRGC